MSSLTLRLTLLISALMVVGACLVTFIPANPDRFECGTWVDPNWPEEESKDLALEYAEMADATSGTTYFSDMGAEAAGNAYFIADAVRTCGDATDGRRLWTFILLGAAIVLPAGTWFVTSAKREKRPPAAA